jgi:N-acetylglutamate synthase-like GNAT family acetyltransferase
VIKSNFTPFAYGVLDVTGGEIKGLYTAENYRGEGHGSKILKQFETIARNQDLDQLTVKTPLNAVGFFERYDFREIEETTPEEFEFPVKLMKKLLE